MNNQHDPRRGRWAFLATVAAFLWGLALVVGAFIAPVYSSGSTLIEVNGLEALVPVGAPAVLALLVGLALHRQCSRGSRGSEYVAAGLVGLLVAFAAVAMFSIGVFVLPVALLLAIAATLTPSPSVPPPSARIGYP